jgi:hypothetical protein
VTEVNVKKVTRDGVTVPETVTPNGAFVVPANDGNVIVEITNSGGTSASAIFEATALVSGFQIDDLVVTVLAGQTLWVGPLPPAVFNDGRGRVSGTSETGLQIRALRI